MEVPLYGDIARISLKRKSVRTIQPSINLLSPFVRPESLLQKSRYEMMPPWNVEHIRVRLRRQPSGARQSFEVAEDSIHSELVKFEQWAVVPESPNGTHASQLLYALRARSASPWARLKNNFQG
jgi:hypothetical protein